jgi:hypothetical protein
MRRYVCEFIFTHEIKSIYSTVAILTAKYDVLFTHSFGESHTHIRISPDFGPVKFKSVKDVGITWKSIIYGYNLCRRHADAHLQDWVEMDLSTAVKGNPVTSTGGQVIPDTKLSTGLKVQQDV